MQVAILILLLMEVNRSHSKLTMTMGMTRYSHTGRYIDYREFGPTVTRPPEIETTESSKKQRSATPTDRTKAFEAFDCSSPRQATPVRITPTDKDCESTTAEAVQQENVTYVVLQEAEYVKIKGKICVRTETEIAMYCGNYDHQTLMPQFTNIEKSRHVFKKECEEWTRTSTFVDPLGGLHSLREGHVNTFKYERAGQTTLTTDHVDCVGGEVSRWGRRYNHVNIFTQTKIEIREIEFDIDADGAVIDGTGSHLLPCRQQRGACETQRGTYVWQPLTAKQHCRYHRARMSSGIRVTGTEDQLSFFSTDGTMLRLTKLRRVAVCNRSVWATNYKKIFLTDEVNEQIFQKPLHIEEMSVITYVNQQDSFLYGTLTKAIKDEFAAVWRTQCHQERQDAREALGVKAAAQQVVAEGETTSLGNGWFATAAGEIWYKYQCDRIVVRGRNTKECYSSLPVALSDRDIHRWQAARTRHGKDGTARRGLSIAEEEEYLNLLPKVPDFFIEPLTRKLTTVGIVTPCSSPFTPLYQNIVGWWIRVSQADGLQDAPVPQLLLPEEYHQQEGDFKELDFEYGGIYTPEAIVEMDRHAQNPRLTKDLTNRIVRQSNMGGHGDLSPSNIFKELPDGLDFDTFSLVVTWMRDWGHFWSIVLGIGVAIRICTFLFGFCIRCKNGHPHPRCNEQCGRCGTTMWRVAAALFPSLFALAPIHQLRRLPPRGKDEGGFGEEDAVYTGVYRHLPMTPADYTELAHRLKSWAVEEAAAGRPEMAAQLDFRADRPGPYAPPARTTALKKQYAAEEERQTRARVLLEERAQAQVEAHHVHAQWRHGEEARTNELQKMQSAREDEIAEIQDKFVRDQRQLQDQMDAETRVAASSTPLLPTPVAGGKTDL